MLVLVVGREKYHRHPTEADFGLLQTMASDLIASNNNSIVASTLTTDTLHSLCLPDTSSESNNNKNKKEDEDDEEDGYESVAIKVTVCSVMGSFLSQEIIKSISHIGEPGMLCYNGNCSFF